MTEASVAALAAILERVERQVDGIGAQLAKMDEQRDAARDANAAEHATLGRKLDELAARVHALETASVEDRRRRNRRWALLTAGIAAGGTLVASAFAILDHL